jgi:hypothetical protein
MSPQLTERQCPEKFEEFPGLSPRNLSDFRGNVSCLGELILDILQMKLARQNVKDKLGLIPI